MNSQGTILFKVVPNEAPDSSSCLKVVRNTESTLNAQGIDHNVGGLEVMN